VSEYSRDALLDCSEFREGVEHFDTKRFWHAHESWETIWLASSGDQKTFLQGLIQLTAAYHLLGRGRFPGALRLFRSSASKLSASSSYGSAIIDLPAILAYTTRAIPIVESAVGAAISVQFPEAPVLASLLAQTEISNRKSSGDAKLEILERVSSDSD